jgi:hypothetical protein
MSLSLLNYYLIVGLFVTTLDFITTVWAHLINKKHHSLVFLEIVRYTRVALNSNRGWRFWVISFLIFGLWLSFLILLYGIAMISPYLTIFMFALVGLRLLVSYSNCLMIMNYYIIYHRLRKIGKDWSISMVDSDLRR